MTVEAYAVCGRIVVDGMFSTKRTVKLASDSGRKEKAVTDAQGQFCFSVPPGKHSISVQVFVPAASCCSFHRQPEICTALHCWPKARVGGKIRRWTCVRCGCFANHSSTGNPCLSIENTALHSCISARGWIAWGGGGALLGAVTVILPLESSGNGSLGTGDGLFRGGAERSLLKFSEFPP